MSALNSWTEEQQSAYLYSVMSQCELNGTRKKLFQQLEIAAKQQAEIWEQQIKKSGEQPPGKYHPNLHTKVVAFLIKIFGIKRLRVILSTMKVRGLSVYSDADPQYPYPPTATEHERRHKSAGAGGNLRAAVFGVNDGLLSNASLLFGIVGANADHHFIVLSGIAGLLAGACSMAAGEFVSVSSQRELFDFQIDLERKELELYPEEEAAELAIIYQARGLPKDQAEQVAATLISNPDKALDTLSREELNINPSELSSPWGAASSSFVSFCMGAFIPLLPFLLGNYHWNITLSMILTGVALFSIGATLSLFTNRSALLSGMRMLLIGAAAGVITFYVGKLIGVAIN